MNRKKTNLGRRTVNTISVILGTVLGVIGCGNEPPSPPDETGGSGGAGMTSSSSSTGVGGMAGAGAGTVGGLGGQPCSEASDCPGVDTECRSRACLKNHCLIVPALAGAPVKKQSIGDCKQRVCDKAGNVVEKLDDSDFLNDQNDCTVDQCNAGQAQNTPLSIGSACSSNGGKTCDGQGSCVECNVASDCATAICVQHKCVPASCADGVQNGKETSIDCGGGDCPACVGGDTCNVADDCASGICNQGICTEQTCSDGKKNGGETDIDCGGTCNTCSDGKTCDIGLDCASTVCTMNVCQPASCGDGILSAPEACDDGNTNAGDGCSEICVIEAGYRCSGVPSICLPKPPAYVEIEQNDLCSNANGPFSVPFIYSGSLTSVVDADFVGFTVPNEADVRIDVRSPLTGTCEIFSVPSLQLIAPDCMTSLTPQVITGLPNCPGLDPTLENGLRHLMVGNTYYLRVDASFFISTFPFDHELEITFSALCGNGVKESSEECDDGGPSSTCDAACKRVPVCGDGLVEGAETCEDGNTIDGDCCSSTCQFEVGVVCAPRDVEPNGTCAKANGPFALPNAVNMPFEYEGSILPAGDVDHITITVPNYADIQLETFDPDLGQCVAADTVIELRDAACNTLLVSDDDDGLANCSRIAASLDNGANHLAPGTYDLKVKHFSSGGVIPHYKLAVSLTALCNNGVREGSEVCDGDAGCNADCTAPPVCGDGLLHPDEKCDDQNTMSGDGCSATCTLEPGYQCNSSAPTICSPSETNCSDGQDNDNDGQTDVNDADCQIPTYFPFCLANQTRHVFKSVPALGLTIPEYTSNGVSHSLTIPNIGPIARAAMLVNITHPAVADIDLSLTPPGAAMPLDVCSDNGGFSDNFINTVFDSTCLTSVVTGYGPFTKCYQPETAFGPLAGTSAEGLWKITVVDDDAYDIGTLDNWAMIFCTTP